VPLQVFSNRGREVALINVGPRRQRRQRAFITVIDGGHRVDEQDRLALELAEAAAFPSQRLASQGDADFLRRPEQRFESFVEVHSAWPGSSPSMGIFCAIKAGRPTADKRPMPHCKSDSSLTPDEASVQRALEGLDGSLADFREHTLRLSRLASLGTITSMLAHEVNNMLTPVVGYCQAAQREGGSAALRLAVDRALVGASHIQCLCQRLLQMAAGEPAALEPVPVGQVLHEVLECFGRQLAVARIRMTIDAPPSLTVRADRASLRQVIFNLVLNARQAMNDRGGTLHLSARQDEDRGRVVLEVRDSGPGIPQDQLERIFEPFSGATRGGSGLGLAVCQRLMAEQAGTIDVRSALGQGAAFILTLAAA
jgi:signal transduction histidine kinase